MIQVTSREFRTKQATLLDIADSGEKVLIRRRGNRSYLLVSIWDNDMEFTPQLGNKLEEARAEYRRGETISFKSADDAMKFLESL